MSGAPLRVLLVEDQETGYWITRRLLAATAGRPFLLDWYPAVAGGLEALEKGIYDVCLVDDHLPDGDGIGFLQEVHRRGLKSPIILLTGQGNDQTGVDAMRAGASDFLVKTELYPALLERSIRYAVDRFRAFEERRRANGELRASELRFRSVVESANDAIILADENARIMLWNKGAENIFQYREDEILGFPIELLLPERYRDSQRVGFERFRLSGKFSIVGKRVELEGLRKDGSDFPLELSLASWSANEGTFFTAVIRDITERRRAEEQRLAMEAAQKANRAKSSKQVLINLLDNALKFTSRGSVTIRVHVVEHKPVRIDIEDTGRGIPAGQLEKIFEPFQQVTAPASPRPPRRGGTGLGLAISRSLCEILGYRLEVRSRLGRGSTFTILLNADSHRLPLSA